MWITALLAATAAQASSGTPPNFLVILLDDVGKELRGTRIALAETTFDEILRQRVQAGRATFITTNMD